MGYNFTKVETQDGFDYTFFSEKSRKLCTVGFDRSVIFAFDDFSETLSNYGVPMLFTAKYIEDPVPQHEPDTKIGATISIIVKDFLNSAPKNTFVVYECEAHKDKGVFSKWFDKEDSPDFIKRGIIVEFSGNGDSDKPVPMALGFITKIDNPTLQNAEQDLELFFYTLMLSNDDNID